MAEINDWDVTDANNNAAPPDGWPENTMNYSEVNDTGRAVQGKVKRFFADINGSLAATGTANTYAVTLNAGYTAYFDGMFFVCSIPVTNNGASTMNVNSLGNKPIKDFNGDALSGNILRSGGLHAFYYDGTDLRVLNESAIRYRDFRLDATTTRSITAENPVGTSITSLLFVDNGNFILRDTTNARDVLTYNRSANTLTVSSATFTINGVEVVDVSSAQTLTNKTFNGSLEGNTIQVGRMGGIGTASISQQSGTGLTASYLGTGIYRLTHNLGKTTYTCICTPNSSNAVIRPYIFATNYVDIATTVAATGAFSDQSAFEFMLVQF